MHKCCLPLVVSFCTSQCILQKQATANYYRGGESELQRSYLSKSLLRTSIIQAKSRLHKLIFIMHEVLITYRKAVELCSKPEISQLSLELPITLPISQALGALVCFCGQYAGRRGFAPSHGSFLHHASGSHRVFWWGSAEIPAALSE